MLKNKSTHFVIIFATIFAVQGAVAADNTSTTRPAIADYTRQLSFEPNRGQTDKQFDFLAHGTGYSLFLSHGEAVMALYRDVTVRMRSVGANPLASAESLEPQPSKSNYFIGNVPERWHTNIPNYARVRYGSVYPGIDLIYYGNQRQLEYDFVVSPGTDPDKILLDFQGAAKAALSRSGDLVMHIAAGNLRWHKPIAYQEIDGNRRLVTCAYARKRGQRLAFKVAPYDQTKPLIIDPVLEYSTYLGGNSVDEANAIAVDANGNAYVTGFTGGDFPTKDAFQNSAPGFYNAFVTKFNADGDLVYSTYLGGSGSPFNDLGDQGNGVAVDAHGNAYVTGLTDSADFPLKNAFQKELKTGDGEGDSNAFVTKLDPDGSALIYSTYLGGTVIDQGKGIAVDAHGAAYVTGWTFSSDFPIKDAFQKHLNGGGDAFVAKFSAGGSLVYSSYLGGNQLDYGNAIAVDAHGEAYVTGNTGSTDFPTKNAFQAKKHAGNAFVTKFDAAGTALVYSTYLGGSGGENGNAIAVNSQGHAYVTGYTFSTDFPTKHAFQKTLKNLNGGANPFVTKFDRDGDSLVYSTYLGGSGCGRGCVAGLDSGRGIAVDEHGNAYVTGTTVSTDFPTKDAFQGKLKSQSGNAFVTKIDAADCALAYSSYLGGSGLDSSSGIGVDPSGNAYVAGTTTSTDFPTKNAFQDKLKSTNGNAFVTKISAR